jgi:hypothetical protein
MIDQFVIMGVVIAFTEAIKDKFPNKKYYVIPTIVLAGLLQAANAYFFGADVLVKDAIVQGVQWGAMASGVYGLGKAFFEKGEEI